MSGWLQLPLYSLVELLAKASLLMACGLLLGSMRRAGPAPRHTILFLSMCGALALPLLSLVTPRWSPAVLPAGPHGAHPTGSEKPGSTAVRSANQDQARIGVQHIGRAAAEEAVVSAAASRTVETRAPADRNRSVGLVFLIVIWPLGTLLVLGRLLAGRLRLRTISARAWVVKDAAWTRLIEEEKLLAGVSGHVRLLVSPAATTPLTWGTRSPIVLLPEDAMEWTSEHRRIVLRHELAHVARGDALTQSLVAITCAVYWFHPLAFITAKRLRTECERACDDRVVALGTGAREYASHLLDVARAAREMGAPGLLSLAMARPSQLEVRMLSVLDTSRPRAMPTRRAQLMAVSLPLALALAVSAFHPMPRVPASDEDAAAAESAMRTAPEGAASALHATAPPARANGGPRVQAPGADRLATAEAASFSPPILEHVTAPVTLHTRGDIRPNVEILLRADLTLPRSAPVWIVLSAGENLVLVNDRFAHPLDLRVAIELAKQARTKYGRDIPGGVVQIPVAPHRAGSMTPSDAEPYAGLMNQLLRAPMEELNGRPAARHVRFEEHPDVEIAVSDSALEKLMRKSF